MSLTERLDKIRSQPKLQNLQHTSVLLHAVEDTLKSQNAEPTPTAYFAALLSCLGGYISTDKGIENKELAYAVVYLMDLVTPHVSAPLLRSKFSQILTSIAPALVNQDAEAPLIRSSIGCLESLLKVQDAAAWNLPASEISPRRAVAGLLNLAVDPRPKVRKRAQEAIANVLKSTPPSPSLDHPAADMCAETALRGLHEEAQKAAKAKGRKQKEAAQQNEPQLIHALQLVKLIASAANGWPSRKIDALCELLLSISKSSHEYLVMSAFEVFEIIFAGLADEVSSAKLPQMLEVLGELQPSKDDSQLLPPWIAVLSRGYEVAAQIAPEDTFAKLPELFTTMSQFLTSASHNIRESASECLVSFLHNCVPDSVLLDPSIMDEKVFGRIGKAIEELLSIRYQSAWMEVFRVVAEAFDTLKWQSSPALIPALKAIGDLRGNDSFAGKKEADRVIEAAISAIGPDKVLELLPLNLLKPQRGHVGRAWMLPIMRDSVRNTRLAHFSSELVPLSEAMFQRVLDHQGEKTMEIKIYETIVAQIWATFPGYCSWPLDLTEAFDQKFAEMTANLLYSQPQLRSDLCKGLRNLIETNQIADVPGVEEDLIAQGRISKADAKKNLEHLAGFASNMLAVLFNVYGQTLPQYRGLILTCINAYLSIVPQQELMETFDRVAAMLESSLAEAAPQTQADKQKQNTNDKGEKMPPTSQTLMDLVIAISIYLPPQSFVALFNMASIVINKNDDPQLQKKAYKLIPRLAETESGKAALEARNTDLQQLLITAGDKATAPAKRDRLDAIAQIIPTVPSSDLHFIPFILSEVVISCKEVNEKARTAAFDLLVLMGEKMSEGGTVVNSKVPSMAEDAPSVQASLEEYFTMVSAGLAGATPNMISATITALARLLYEFRQRLAEAAIVDLVQTIDLFLTSANREIVRSCLGFVKVCVLSLPTPLMEPRLHTLIPNLCVWSHEHKAQFKAKVKHIFERMIKRFGVELVEKHTPADDKKLIANIRKTRDRAKRKKDAAAADNADDEDVPQTQEKRKGKFESEYDQAIYGSESEEGDSGSDISDDEVLGRSAAKGKRASQHGQQYIIEDEDEPLDLLDRRALAHVSSTKPLKARTVADTKRKAAKTDLDGKLVFNENDADDGDDVMDFDAGGNLDIDPGDGSLEGGINAYVEAIKSKDAARRGQKGKLKFSQKGHKDDDAGEEMEVDQAEFAAARKAAGRGRGRGRGDARGRGQGQRRGLGVDRARNGPDRAGGVGKPGGRGRGGSGGGGGFSRGGSRGGGGFSRGGRGGSRGGGGFSRGGRGGRGRN
ncbi:hypothetical protein MBLNU457_g2528t1 [Dothideomycetes sp. NU457]